MTHSAENHPQLRTEAVVRFLEQNPDFLIRHGFAGPTQKARVIDLSRTLIRRAGKILRDYDAARATLADIQNTNAENMERTHQAAYLLMAAADAGEVITIIHEHLPAILGIAAARLLVPEGSALCGIGGGTVIALAPSTLSSLAGGARGMDLGAPDEAQSKVFSGITETPPESVAFAALPEIIPGRGSGGVLALAGNNAASFRADDAGDYLAFTTTMIAIALIARGGGAE